MDDIVALVSFVAGASLLLALLLRLAHLIVTRRRTTYWRAFRVAFPSYFVAMVLAAIALASWDGIERRESTLNTVTFVVWLLVGSIVAGFLFKDASGKSLGFRTGARIVLNATGLLVVFSFVLGVVLTVVTSMTATGVDISGLFIGLAMATLAALGAWWFIRRYRAATVITKALDQEEPLAKQIGAAAPTTQSDGKSPAVASAPLPATGAKSNYLFRHWRGELSLGLSYWVNGALIASVCPIVLAYLLGEMRRGSNSLRAVAIASVGVLVFAVSAWLWSAVGIWRSADRHAERGGRAGWAAAAKVMVFIGAVAMVGALSSSIVPQLREYTLIAIGQDPIGKPDIKVGADGQSVIVRGPLGEGAADELLRILDAAPAARTIVFNSRGGRLMEAQTIARTIKTRGLDTYVEDLCASACTYAFLAGRQRAATPNARIGFHQPFFVGLNASAQRVATQEMIAVYREAGLPNQFLQRVANTSPEHMWYPTRDELIEARVITRVSLGGEAAQVGLAVRSKQELLMGLRTLPLFQAMERRFPEAAKSAVDRAWAAKEAGGKDADIFNAIRSVVADLYTPLLKTADDPTLDQFLRLLSRELVAARAVSVEACSKLLDGQLDITKTLPKELVEEDQTFLLHALESPPRSDQAPVNPTDMDKALRSATADMPAELIPVMASPNGYADQPQLRCDATIAFYRAIAALPTSSRILVLRGIFQSKS